MIGRARPSLRTAAWILGGLVAVGLNLWLDRTAPDQFSFEIFYVIPILVVTLFGGRYAGALVALVSALAWSYDTMQEEDYALLSMGWDVVTRSLIFVGLAVLVDLYNKRGRRLTAVDRPRADGLALVAHQLR